MSLWLCTWPRANVEATTSVWPGRLVRNVNKWTKKAVATVERFHPSTACFRSFNFVLPTTWPSDLHLSLKKAVLPSLPVFAFLLPPSRLVFHLISTNTPLLRRQYIIDH